MGCPDLVYLGDNLVFSICTHDPDTGRLTDADEDPSYRIYKDVTAPAILNGSMPKLDDANTIGFYAELIACTTGNGFEIGKTYTIYIKAPVDADTGGIPYTFVVRASIWDEVIEGTLTARILLRIFKSWLVGLCSGGGTTNLKFRDDANLKDRIDEIVDENGNRTSVTLDGS